MSFKASCVYLDSQRIITSKSLKLLQHNFLEIKKNLKSLCPKILRQSWPKLMELFLFYSHSTFPLPLDNVENDDYQKIRF